jgi:uncharacterized repeat protein (TIGR01451 family)
MTNSIRLNSKQVIPVVAVVSASIAFAGTFLLVQHRNHLVRRQVRTSRVRPETGVSADQPTERAFEDRPVSGSYRNLPISFTANQGQADGDVKYTAQGNGYELALTQTEAVVLVTPVSGGAHRKETSSSAGVGAMARSGSAASVRMKFVGANPKAALSGTERLEGVSNYLFGNDPRKWHLNVPTYAKVQYKDVYPGIDLVYYGAEGRLEYDLIVSPGADPAALALQIEGGDELRRNPAGDLVIQTKAGAFSWLRPTVYQIKDGKRELVDAEFELASDKTLHFKLGSYDRRRELVIDPVLQYSTFIGGSSLDGGIYLHGYGFPSLGQGIAVDSKGEAVVVGATFSTNFPTANAFQSSFGTVAGNRWVAYVSKFNSSGSGLIYSTFFGGSTPQSEPAASTATGVSVDSTGAAYVTGMTGATDFPVKNAYQSHFGGEQDAYVAKFSPTGGLVYSTYIGGKSSEESRAVAIDNQGNAYITGWTNGGFPTSTGSFNPSTQGGIFVASLNASGSALRYSGILGGVDQSSTGYGIAVDGSGNAYVTGTATSLLTAHAFQPKLGGGGNDAFVTKINPAGSGLVYSTYLGGTGRDTGNSIAVDSSGEAYVGGTVWATYQTVPTFPVTSNAFSSHYSSAIPSDGFIAKLSASGGLLYSSFFGGGEVLAVAVDQYHTMYFGGYTASSDFPQVGNLTPFGPGGINAFVSTLVPSGVQGKSIAYYSTFLTRAPNSTQTTGINDQVLGIAVDSALNAYVTGYTWNTDFPTTKGAFHTVSRGQSDAFVSKLVIAADLGLAISASPNEVNHGANLVYTLTTHNNGPDYAAYLKLDDPIPSGTAFVSYNAGGGTCTAPAVGGTGTLSCQLTRLDSGGNWSVQLNVQVIANSGSSIVNNGHIRSNMQDLVWQNNYATETTAVR